MEAGSFVVVQKLGGATLRVCALKAGQKTTIDKLQLKLDSAIDKPFNKLFNVASDGSMTLVEDITAVVTAQSTSIVSSAEAPESTLTNGDSLCDEPGPAKRQRISQEALRTMRESGAARDVIVSSLIGGNVEYERRTEHSKTAGRRKLLLQEKYVRNKRLKHQQYVWLWRPTLRLLAQAHYAKDPSAVSHLRPDSLNALIVRANIRPGTRVVVIDQCQGLVVAACLQQMDGHGTLVHLHAGDSVQMVIALQQLSLSERVMRPYQTLPKMAFLNHLVGKSNAAETDKREEIDMTTVTEEQYNATIERRQKRAERQRKHAEIISTLRDCDAVIVALRSTECLTSWLKNLLPLLSYGGIVCAYTSGAEQATAAHNYLWAMQKEEGTTIAPQEIYFGSQRPRVEPFSTHPLMQQDVTFGYILSAQICQPAVSKWKSTVP